MKTRDRQGDSTAIGILIGSYRIAVMAVFAITSYLISSNWEDMKKAVGNGSKIMHELSINVAGINNTLKVMNYTVNQNKEVGSNNKIEIAKLKVRVDYLEK